MKKVFYLLFFLVLSLTNTAFSQEVTIKKDVVSVEGVEICVLSDDPKEKGSFYVDDLTGSHLIYFKWIFAGDLNYYEIFDADDLEKVMCEEANVASFKKNMMKKLYNAEVITTDGFDQKAFERHTATVGKEFTRIQEEKSRK